MKKLIDAEIKKETEKAIQVDVTIDTALGRKAWTIWLPKTQIEIREDGIYASDWILTKKSEEISANYAGAFYGIEAGNFENDDAPKEMDAKEKKIEVLETELRTVPCPNGKLQEPRWVELRAQIDELKAQLI